MSIGYNRTKYPNMTQTSYYQPREEKPEYVRPASEKVIRTTIVEPEPEPIKVKQDPVQNLIRQEPAGVIVLKNKREKVIKYKKPRKNQIVYYSSEDEEIGQVKKVYKNDNRFRNYYCLNVCKGHCASCCPFFNCCEWFYGCPLWIYLSLVLLFLALLATFATLLVLVIQAPQYATPVTITRIYNRTW